MNFNFFLGGIIFCISIIALTISCLSFNKSNNYEYAVTYYNKFPAIPCQYSAGFSKSNISKSNTCNATPEDAFVAQNHSKNQTKKFSDSYSELQNLKQIKDDIDNFRTDDQDNSCHYAKDPLCKVDDRRSQQTVLIAQGEKLANKIDKQKFEMEKNARNAILATYVSQSTNTSLYGNCNCQKDYEKWNTQPDKNRSSTHLPCYCPSTSKLGTYNEEDWDDYVDKNPQWAAKHNTCENIPHCCPKGTLLHSPCKPPLLKTTEPGGWEMYNNPNKLGNCLKIGGKNKCMVSY